MPRRVVHDGRDRLLVEFPFDRDLLSRVKGFSGRQWDGREKRWSVPDLHVVKVVEMLVGEHFQLCEVTRRLYRERGGTLDLDATTTGGRRLAGSSHEAQAAASAKPRGSTLDFTVSRLNELARATLRDAFRAPVWLVGEISGFNKKAHKRTVGFQLVERDSQGGLVAEIAATLFEDRREEIEEDLRAAGDPFRLEDEVPVRVCGRVELYVPWGEFRVVIDSIDVEYTLGEAARRRDEIRGQLVAEGILELNRSLPVPALPLRVGIVTSIDSDAYNDVLQTLRGSGFAFRVTVHGARVQGRQTEPSVLAAMAWFRGRFKDFDVLLICRGGGSRTDLAWLDSLAIARAVATSPIPVVVGIGHEKDISALDFVGRSQKTPTAAAEWIVAQVRKASDRLEAMLQRTLGVTRHLLGAAMTELASLTRRVPRVATVTLARRSGSLRDAERRLRRGAQREISSASSRVEEAAARLLPQASKRLAAESERLEVREKRLALLDPKRVIERGYAIVRLRAGKVLTDPAQAPRGALVVAELKSGSLQLRSEGSSEE